jgi:hypothetical protein
MQFLTTVSMHYISLPVYKQENKYIDILYIDILYIDILSLAGVLEKHSDGCMSAHSSFPANYTSAKT